ncbi:DUF4391 domain-containing protein [Bacillus rubiinfantis]|uniref:DUF4391 domain-containing protein n=1 Tax=Bacillus rubiinfantis TaxID=1499680 RepID=UPI0005A93E74|nr:DUF4391 domain-containing protein [Bacillus rubiinfantis]
MLDFPSKAVVGRIMPKEAFYKRLVLSSDLRNNFVSDIKRITMEYKLSPNTLNVEKAGEVSEILVLSIELKKKEVDYRIIENIARQNAHKLLFLLKFEDEGQLVIYHNKLYKAEWHQLSEIALETIGLNIDTIWVGFIEQIALQEEATKNENLTVEEKLKKQEMIFNLQNEIHKLEKRSRKEKQPKKRFELFTQLQGLKKKLKEEIGE